MVSGLAAFLEGPANGLDKTSKLFSSFPPHRSPLSLLHLLYGAELDFIPVWEWVPVFLLQDKVAGRCFYLPSSNVPVHVSVPRDLRSFDLDCERVVCAGSGGAELYAVTVA